MRTPGIIAFAALFLAAGSIVAVQAQRERRLEDRVRDLEREARRERRAESRRMTSPAAVSPVKSLPTTHAGVSIAIAESLPFVERKPKQDLAQRTAMEEMDIYTRSPVDDFAWAGVLGLSPEKKSRIIALLTQKKVELEGLTGPHLPEDDNRRAFRNEIEDRYEQAIVALMDPVQQFWYAELKLAERDGRVVRLVETLAIHTGETRLPRPTD